MWLFLAFASACLLGFYDVSKKQGLRNNAVIPVLWLNTLFSSLIFVPFIVLSNHGVLSDSSIFFTQSYGWAEHRYILLKSCIVLASWILGYFGIKHLPITIVGPINASRPVMVLVGALTFFGEHLNLWQWAGVIIAIISFFMLSRAGKREGLDFKHNKWIVMVVASNMLGALSGLYDKYLMAPASAGGIGLDRMAVQSWYNIYQFFMMFAMLMLLWWPVHKKTTPFHWHWAIPLVSIFLSAADFMYFYSLSLDGALISVVSMVRRGSVLVSFACGAMLFHEKNLRRKFVDLILMLISMLLLFIGSE
jgi:drug/metabolite transporter (DMT)-like permease